METTTEHLELACKWVDAYFTARGFEMEPVTVTFTTQRCWNNEFVEIMLYVNSMDLLFLEIMNIEVHRFTCLLIPVPNNEQDLYKILSLTNF